MDRETNNVGPEQHWGVGDTAFEIKKSIETAIVFGVYFGLTVLAAYAIPHSILSEIPVLRDWVDRLGGLVSGVNRFGKWSDFPEVAQFLYSIQLISIPFLVAWGVISLKIHLLKITSKKQFLKALFAPILFGSIAIVLIFLAYPSSPDLDGPFGRLSIQSYTSKISFSFYSSLFVLGSAFCLVFCYVALRDMVLVLFYSVRR